MFSRKGRTDHAATDFVATLIVLLVFIYFVAGPIIDFIAEMLKNIF